MIARELINHLIPALQPNDHVERVRDWMAELHISELPVISEKKFIGFIDEEMLLQEDVQWDEVGEFPLLGQSCQVNEDMHYYDVLRVANEQGYKVVAVLNHFEEYLGAISVIDMVEIFANSSSVNAPGAILGIGLGLKDYSLAEISHVVESNEAKILSSSLSLNDEVAGEHFLTLKINTEEVNHIVASLQNKGFDVRTSFNTSNNNQGELDRLDMLMKYIKI